MDEIMVSIVCITYNHEKYIRDAIEGFLNQKVNFRYEILIHDDVSSDSTAEIIKKYEKQYPGIICGLYETNNQYSKIGVLLLKDIYKKCRGKYIAICEGDDYWIDCNKLQLQVDYMENHEDCTLLMHDGIKIDCKEGTVKAMCPYDSEQDLSAKDLILQRQIPTASFMCRRCIRNIDDFFYKSGMGDYPAQLYCLTKGRVHYFNRIMSAYRHMHEGSWTKNIHCNIKNTIHHFCDMWDFLREYDTYTDSKYSKYIISRGQSCITQILNLTATLDNFHMEHFFDLDDCDNREKFYYSEIRRIYMQTYDENYLDDEIRNMALRRKNIVIMGAGNYGAMVAKQLRNKGIEFDGFVVSKSDGISQDYMGKPKWLIDTLPFISEEKRDFGVIVAINPVIWHEIADTLEQYKIEHWRCLYLMRDYRNGKVSKLDKQI